MLARWLFAGDFHKKIMDPPTIMGYCACNAIVQKRLIDMCIEEGVTHFGSLGDWYDRGFHTDNASVIPEYDMDIEMYHKLNKNFYGLIGNHIKLKLDSNPELFLIQPHEIYKTRKRIQRNYQIIKTPEKLRFGGVQISFMHFNGNRKSLTAYKPMRDEDATYHIALFHTPWVIPNQQLIAAGLTHNVYTVSQISEVLRGVDLAICGDIHDPIGRFIVNHDYGQTVMVIPGSLSNTTSDPRHRHTSIYLPLITINDDSSVSIEFKFFDLCINTLAFRDAEAKKKQEEKLDGIRAKRKKEDVQVGELRSVFDISGPDAYSLQNLMKRKGYSTADRAMVKSIINNPMDVDSLVTIFHDEDPAL